MLTKFFFAQFWAIKTQNTLKISFLNFWTLDVSRAAFFEITLARPFVRLSVCPSIAKFPQDWIVCFPDVVHDDS